MILTDEQWHILQPLFPSRTGPGRPPADPRLVLDACLWRLLHSSSWRHIPSTYPAYTVCFRLSQRWRATGVLRRVMQ